MDHVWDKYLSEHKGKQPRNAFDLVNFSRNQTDATLTFPEAKILYQQKSNNSSAITLHSFN